MRYRLQIRGVVQGVGFRPFVYRLALRHGLTGLVGNDDQGVLIEVQGGQQTLDLFIDELRHDPPPLARIASIQQQTIADLPGETAFTIRDSRHAADGAAWISPDIATCADCLREMLDPADRRYRYPFINCTNCGPRFTITLRTPYDRPATTMAAFSMCSSCQDEYDSPGDRRFHAQPNACPACGPQLAWVEQGVPTLHREHALHAARHALRSGRIVAIKGIGGFHLAVDATNHDAVLRLRERKHRYGKPLAVMVDGLEAARRLARISPAEARLLESPERPIVLLERLSLEGRGDCLSPAVAPTTSEIGLLLPYTGLHNLLLEGLGPLVMTSGNLSQQPILWRNEDALEALSSIADGILLHNRDIRVPCDDSVARILTQQDRETESPIRRSRGYAPLPAALPRTTGTHPSILAVGAELKSTLCLTRGNQAFLSQHLGDMESYETLTAFEQALEHLTAVFRVQPELVACDLHPGYLSSQWAARYAARHELPLLRVQHHHAHLASAMTEHGLDGNAPVQGILFDGTGYGADTVGDGNTIWGGEFLTGDYASFQRRLRLRPIPLPGGDAAVRHPYRAALAALDDAGIAWEDSLSLVRETPAAERAILHQQLHRGFNLTPSSSMGRLFDVVAAILSLRRSVQFEAQAAIELEAIAAPHDDLAPYPFTIEPVPASADPLHQLDTRPLLQAIVLDTQRGVPVPLIAGRFHQTVLHMALAGASWTRDATGIDTVVLSGGVWQNRLLATRAPALLRGLGLRVLEHHRVPANDGGLALGQAAIAASRLQ